MANKNISSLHYITPNLESGDSYLEDIRNACQNGATWIQLRMKESPWDMIRSTAVLAREICHQYDATLIINDHPDIAHEIDADGVHVGKEDEKVDMIRQKYGPDMLIGATANTFEDIMAVYPYVDYIGLGPFRFTVTKKNLSPVLGENGYNEILQKCVSNHIYIPVVAIGGIQLEDLSGLQQTGVHGVAISGLLHQCAHDVATIKTIKKQFEHVKNS